MFRLIFCCFLCFSFVDLFCSLSDSDIALADSDSDSGDSNIDRDTPNQFVSQTQILENQNLGCLFDSALCNNKQKCVDDSLFGTCIPAYADTFSFKYKISPQLISQLKLLLLDLLKSGYTWHDTFTQCIVRSTLLSFSVDLKPDFSLCEEFKESKIDLQKREELLQRKKYDYVLDIPEKRLQNLNEQSKDSSDTDWEEGRAINYDNVEGNTFEPASHDEDEQYQYPSKMSPAFPDYYPMFDDFEGKEALTRDNTAENKVSDLQDDFPLDSMSPEDAKTIADLLEGRTEEAQLSDSELNHVIDVLARLFAVHDKSRSRPTATAEHMAPAAEIKDTEQELRQLISEPKSDWKTRIFKEFNKRGDTDSIVDGRFLWIEFRKPRPILGRQIKEFASKFEDKTGIILVPVSYNQPNNTVYFAIHFQTAYSSKDVVSTINNRTNDIEGFEISAEGLGRPSSRVAAEALIGETKEQKKQRLATTVLVCSVVLAFILTLMVLFLVQRYRSSKKRLQDMTKGLDSSDSQDYQDLCRQRINEKSVERIEPLSASAQAAAKSSPNGSSSSWSDDPVATDMDITTGHIVLNYMEEYLSSKEKIEQEWSTLCSYEADQSSCLSGAEPKNADKNRFSDLLPYDHSRVKLSVAANVNKSDYINASALYDSDPKIKAYILAQSPMLSTIADFWQMIWETGAVVLVNLTNQKSACPDETVYWPSEGSQLYHQFEVHLVSEHIWCDDYLVRNFYLKNLGSGEARTVTMFHFLSWEEDGLPSTKSLLEFRRKVNKSYKGKSSPVVIHCSDGCGRSGTFCLLDMALSRISKGVKEIDLAATLEHLRDQRIRVVKTKTQFEFVITAIAEEVHSVLRTLSQARD